MKRKRKLELPWMQSEEVQRESFPVGNPFVQDQDAEALRNPDNAFNWADFDPPAAIQYTGHEPPRVSGVYVSGVSTYTMPQYVSTTTAPWQGT